MFRRKRKISAAEEKARQSINYSREVCEEHDLTISRVMVDLLKTKKDDNNEPPKSKGLRHARG